MSLVIKDVCGQMSEGLHRVTITRVEDLGQQATQFGQKDCAAIYFTDDEQRGLADVCMRVVKTLHPKSNLVKLLTTLNVPFGETFDLNGLVGIKCEVVIEHKESNGKTDVNIAAVLKVRSRQSFRRLHKASTATITASRDGRSHHSGRLSISAQTASNA